MKSRNDPSSVAAVRLPPLTDEASFREALQGLLTEARKTGHSISDQSWKCDSTATGTTWDVEITTVETR
ncbi:hypothetical protein [Halodesulfurarchaeum sp.]|uniref:hypothetical protein n=1 Tax=Halodesulfurarchaeum sp. TaxID=1980530 RepID=UPI002FC39253